MSIPAPILLFLLGCCLAPAGTARPCPAAIPPGLSAVPVASNVASAGLGLTIRQVQGKEDFTTILDRTEQQWRAAGHAVRRDTTAGWQVLSAFGGEFRAPKARAVLEASQDVLAKVDLRGVTP